MTPNQTIDGVPRLRELLEKLDSLDVDEFQGWAFEVSNELRALLDGPTKLDLVECDACPTSGGCVSVCMKAPKPADQPQGVPVAVVLPERRQVSPSSREQAMCASAWNACLDELKRLNQQLVSQCPGDGVGPCRNCRCDRAGQSPQAEKYDDVLLPFLEMMRKELHANSHKGDREVWLGMTPNQALSEVLHHVKKLEKAEGNAQAIEYAADVANCCMMLLDIIGGLESA